MHCAPLVQPTERKNRFVQIANTTSNSRYYPETPAEANGLKAKFRFLWENSLPSHHCFLQRGLQPWKLFKRNAISYRAKTKHLHRGNVFIKNPKRSGRDETKQKMGAQDDPYCCHFYLWIFSLEHDNSIKNDEFARHNVSMQPHFPAHTLTSRWFVDPHRKAVRFVISSKFFRMPLFHAIKYRCEEKDKNVKYSVLLSWMPWNTIS